MTIALAGALAAALAAICATLIPFAGRTAGPRIRHPDAPALVLGGWHASLRRWEMLRVACVVGFVAIAVLCGVSIIVAAVAGSLAPSIVMRMRARDAKRAVRVGVTRLLRTTEAALRSGASLPEALRRAAEGCDLPAARHPFESAIRAFDLGMPLDEALRAAVRSTVDTPARLALETIAIGVASRLPADRSGALVAAVADRLAFEERLDEEIRARTGGLRFQVALLALIVPGLAIYLALTVPSLASTLTSPIGQTILVPGGLALEVIGLLASRRVVEGATP